MALGPTNDPRFEDCMRSGSNCWCGCVQLAEEVATYVCGERGFSSREVEKQGLAWFVASGPYLLYVRDPERDIGDAELSTPCFQILTGWACVPWRHFSQGNTSDAKPELIGKKPPSCFVL